METIRRKAVLVKSILQAAKKAKDKVVEELVKGLLTAMIIVEENLIKLVKNLTKLSKA
jgi:hypothetical protein